MWGCSPPLSALLRRGILVRVGLSCAVFGAKMVPAHRARLGLEGFGQLRGVLAPRLVVEVALRRGVVLVPHVALNRVGVELLDRRRPKGMAENAVYCSRECQRAANGRKIAA